MWLEHLLFGAVDDTSFAVSCKALPCTVKSLLDINGKCTEKHDSSLTSLRKDNEVKLEDEIKKSL